MCICALAVRRGMSFGPEGDAVGAVLSIVALGLFVGGWWLGKWVQGRASSTK